MMDCTVPLEKSQHMMDCTVLLENSRHGDLPDFVCPDPKVRAILIKSRGIGVMNDGMEQKRNGVSGQPFLPLASRDEERRNTKTKLLCTGQVLLESPDGTEEQLISIITNKIIR